MNLCFATNNKNKLSEVQQMLEPEYTILSLADIDCTEELPEDHETLDENSAQKAIYLWEKYKINCFADDTGLEVYALNNEPGVYSARYAGPQRSNQDNISLLLKNLEGKTDRRARFRTSITLIQNDMTHQFEGIVEGSITERPAGTNGFGYDPVFVPDGYDQTFAEMPAELKNSISHRGRAIAKLVAFLKSDNKA